MCTLQHHVNVDDYEHTAARKRRRVRCIEKAAAARAQEERAVLDEAAKKARLLAWGQLPPVTCRTKSESAPVWRGSWSFKTKS